MSASRRRGRPAWIVGAILGALLLAPAAPAFAAEDDEDVTVTVTIPEEAEPAPPAEGDITDAEFRWGINTESGSGAFAGGCNFLSAGKAGDAGGAKVWTQADGLYAASSGDVRIVKANANGGWSAATFADRCRDRHGDPVSVTSLTAHTESQVVIDGGVGEADDDGVEIRWTGSFTAVMYGGMTYWTATDPVLTLDAKGNGRVTATVSGYATSRDDMGKWSAISPRTAVLAEIRGATLTDDGVAQAPEYVGVTSAVSGQSSMTLDNVVHWGAFPASFMRFQEVVGQAGYWMTTGGQRDRAKVPTTLYVSYDSASPIQPAPGPAPTAGTGAAVSNPVSERALTRGGAIVPVADGAESASPDLIAVDAATVVRDDGSSLIPQAFAGLPAVALPGALTLLSVLAGALSVLHLSGAPVLPWLRRP